MKTVRDNPELGKIDFSDALPVSEVPALAKLQAKRRAEQQNSPQSEIALIAPDVWQLIRQNAQDVRQIERINGMLRVLLT